MTDETTRVDFWFDPSCPWAWMTSRWVDEVSTHRDLDVTWHVMSLAILNENNEMTEGMRAFLPRALRYTQLVTAVKELHGQQFVKPLYDALGTRIHLGQRTDTDAVIAEALEEVGLPAELSNDAPDDPEANPYRFESELRESHRSGIDLVGQDVGTPILAVDGIAFFGPVISPAPTGEVALTLWDGIVAAASFDGFFELKRSRTRDPIFS
ncbi:mycothiol-dependent nitroreductase Rv2466c family protein [Subtercola boreus]|uniref:Disulfide bond formation protein DsbA n=1 Tax=Subtercola boreus TaxID=120213 RepID=A0A3E0WBL5_9MICO|nr:DsbA family protein [Subtercola boreus]RFA21788.1 disulfide bond formation protein DsbA [Subtercola boreus]RFA21899.1 disulfide bond formation protein DsbA [Subtercola boreus]RFA27847.1 disulfide bond formation protein DsbA [Subtercola boreus]